MYKDLNLDIKASNLCAEIMLHSDVDHTFTCVLSSMNLFLYDEWKILMLCLMLQFSWICVAEEFIQAGKEVRGIENAVRFTQKGSCIRIGCLWSSFIYSTKGWAFEGFETHMWNIEAFTLLQNESYRASKWMAGVMGEPEWCVGYGMRNTHTMAVAPTKSTALLMGGVSEGINPDPAMVFTQSTAGGEVDRINPVFLEVMKAKGTD